jgi:hypothetical protein
LFGAARTQGFTAFMKKYFCVSLIVFCCAALNAQKNTQKGLAALSQANFGTAKTYFYKELKKDSLCAAFGLSNYYLTPFGYQADSAFAYLTFFEGAYATLNAKSKTKLQTDLALQDNTAQQLFHQLATSELQVATRAPQIEALELYMERYGQKYPDYKKIVVALRDSLAFDNALKAQSSSAMQAFLVMYPNAVQQQKAKANYDLLLYQERTQHDTEAELKDFIAQYPEHPYAGKAWERLYNKYAQIGTLETFARFIQNYSDSPQAGQAWKQIYRLYMQPYSVEKLAQFKVDYPAYPFLEDLASDGDLLLKKLFPFIQNGSFGYMDHQGKQIIAAQYEDASAFYEGLAIVSKNELFGLINKKNESIIALKYLDISKSAEGFVAEDSAGYYIFNNQGQLLQKEALQWEELQQTLSALSTQVETVEPKVVSKYHRIDKNGKVGLSKQGKSVLPIKYDDIIFSNDSGVIFAKLGKALQYFDTTGKRLEINSLDWFLNAAELASFSKDGIAVFSKAAKLGLMDTKGKVLVKNTYDAAQAVYNGLWPVQQNGKWGLVALDSKIALPLNYEQIVAFPPFGFLVESNEGVGLLFSANKWLLSPTFKTIKRFETSYFLVENQEGLGVYNTDGSPLIPCAYQRIVRLDDGTFQLTNASGLSYYLPIENKIVQLQP